MKKIIAVLMSMILIFPLLITGKVSATADTKSPNIVLNKFSCSSSRITAGNSFDVSFEIDNIGDADANCIVIDV